MTTGAEAKWAKGVSPSARGGTWSMAFQIRGKRHPLSLQGTQAEAAVAYDLAALWGHKAKGNDALRCTSYNFPLAFYPPPLLGQLLSGALGEWEGVRAFIGQLATAGVLRSLVPFEGAGRRYHVVDAEAWRPQAQQKLCINARGVHIFRGSWACVPMEDIESFGAVPGVRLLQLTFVTPLGRSGRGSVAHTFRCIDAGEAYRELQAAAAQRRQAGLQAPRDLGARIVLSAGAAAVAASDAAAAAQCSGSSSEGAEEVPDAADSNAALDAEPSQEELELLQEFAGLARSLSPPQPVHASGNGSVSGSESGSAAPSAHGSPRSPLDMHQLPLLQKDKQEGPEQQGHAGRRAAAADDCAQHKAAAAAPAQAAAAAAAAVTALAAAAAPGQQSPPEVAKRRSSEVAAQAEEGEGQHGQPSSPAAKKQRIRQQAQAASTAEQQQAQAANTAEQQQQQPQQQQAQAAHTAEQQQQQQQQQHQQRLAALQQLRLAALSGGRPVPSAPIPPGMVAFLRQQQEAALKQAAAAAKAGLGGCNGSSSGAVPAGFRPLAMLPMMPVAVQHGEQNQALVAMQMQAVRLHAAAAAAAAAAGVGSQSSGAGAAQAGAGHGVPVMMVPSPFIMAAAAQQHLAAQQRQQQQQQQC